MTDQGIAREHSAEEFVSLQAELADLLAERDRLDMALSAASIRFWEDDLLSGEMISSRSGFELFGLSPDAGFTRFSEWLSHIHPEDRERVQAQVATERVKASADGYSCEYRVVLPNEEIRWLQSHGRVIHDDAGNATRIVGVSRDISEHVEIVMALRESDQRFRELAESVREVFWMHDVREGMQLLYVSPPYEHVWGRRLEDVYKNPGDWLEAIHPDDRKRVTTIFGEAVEAEKDYDAEFRIVRPDGSIRWIHDRGRPIRDESGSMYRYAGLAEDVTDKRAIEEELRQHRERLETLVADRTSELQRRNEELRQSESRLQALFEGIDDVIFVHDEDGRILDCNSAACRRLRYSREELLAMRTCDVDSPSFAQGFEARLAQQRDHGNHRCEGVHIDKEGNEIPVDIMTTVIDFKGQSAVLAVVRDVTEIKKAEHDRRNLEQQMQHTQKLESLGILAGGIAHDFNNLLLGVLGNAELALDNIVPDSPAYEDIKGIEQAAKKAAELCRQMLAYAGKGRFVVEPVDLNTAINDIVGLLETSVSKKVLLRYQLAEGLPPIVADAAQLTQILMNLVSNASDAIGEESGTVTVTTDSMHCTRDYLQTTYADTELKEGLCVTLEVSDSGGGMEDETRQRIFDPFFTTKFAGRGLGLAAVLGIVRSHNGAIRVYSEPGKGSSFKLLFPASDESAQRRSGRTVTASGLCTDGTLLLVDDDETVLGVTRRALERIGFNVATCSDGVEAVDYYRENAAEITCTILDLTMPRMGGEQAFREIRRIDPEAKVILSSGYNEQDVSSHTATRGLAGFIQKPYVRDRLVEVLTSVLGDPEASTP
jgi:PAS domain S-box-containing protein